MGSGVSGGTYPWKSGLPNGSNIHAPVATESNEYSQL